ncbi:hypothetical protein HGA02_14395, partial [Cellulomonas septica]|nr:hypothetical protein [Cellulomonas septica]
MSPDDLPRSPTGRIPQWVVDEAAGRAVAPSPWRSTTPPTSYRTSRRRPGRWIAAGIAVAVGGAVWFSTDGLTTPPPMPPGYGPVAGVPLAPVAPPSAEVVALADAAHLSAEGRDLFYDARPQILGADEFAGKCDRAGSAPTDGGAAVGCYHSDAGVIVIYRPGDERLHGFVVETAAHELLHAAWDRLSAGDRERIVPALEAALASVPADDPLHLQVAGSVGDRPELRATELFAYVGTTVWRDGGLDAGLEDTYARFITDRAALVAQHDDWVRTFDQLAADVTAAAQDLAGVEARAAGDR